MSPEIGKAFKEKAATVIPAFSSDMNALVSDHMTASQVDEVVFGKSEYLGGMAAVVIALAEKELEG